VDIITTHVNADFDGLASMVAARKLYPGATLVFSGGAQEPVRSFLAVHDVGLVRLKDVDLAKVTRLILVDTQELDRVGPFKELCSKPGVSLHIYDHHVESGAGTALKADRVVIEAVGATTTLLVEQLKQRDLLPTSFEATVLALGLYEETGFLAYVSTTPRDLEAAAHVLRAGADLNLVSDTLRSHLDPDQILLLNDLLRESETLYLEGRKVLLATSAYDRYRGDFAEVVHKLAEMEGLDAVIAAIAMDDKVEIIGRSRRPEIDVGLIAREFGGGGHSMAASASVKGRTLVEVRERLAQLLTDRYRPTLLARDVMTTPVKSISEDATVAETEARLTKYEVNVLPVLSAKGRYVGVVSRETIQKALFHKFEETPVAQLMQTDAYTAEPETPFREIQGRMLERNQRFVPILKTGKVVGVITRTDLLRTLHDEVLLSARARAKGEEPTVTFASRRNLRNLIKDRLPARIFAILQKAGELAERVDVSVYAVGGFVRDLLLGRPNLDVDLVVEGDGIAFARAFAKENGARAKVHERFGTAAVVFSDDFKLDIATARTEYYEYPTALPTVERSSIKKDLYRRDFTINTLAIRLNANRFGELLDFYGGQRDLTERTIRVLHGLSFVEDPTRIFRAVRFEHRFGFRLGKETLALIKGAVKMNLFDRLSGSRLREEIILLLSEEEPRRVIGRLNELGLLQFLHRDLKYTSRLDALLKGVEKVLDWYKVASLNWPGAGHHKAEPWHVYFMALMEVLPAGAVGETVKRLHVPERIARQIRTGHGATGRLYRRLAGRTAPRPADIYHALHGLSDDTVLLLMASAKSDAVIRRLSAYLAIYRHVKPSLTGMDLKEMGLKPGPQFKKLLERLLEARMNGEVTSKEEECELIKQLVG